MLGINVEEYNLRILYLVLLAIATVVGNVLVLAAIVLFKSQRRSTNIFLASLAVADLLVGILVVPLYTWWTLKPGLFDDSFCMCGLVLLSCLLVVVASQLNLIVLSVEQFFAVCHPFRHRDVVLRFPSIHVTTSVFVWLSSCIATALSSLAIKRDFRSCSYYGMFDKVFLLLASLFGILFPFVFIIVINVKVLSVAKDHDRRRSSNFADRHIKGRVRTSLEMTGRETGCPEYQPLILNGKPEVESKVIPVLQEVRFQRRHGNEKLAHWRGQGPVSRDSEMEEIITGVKGQGSFSLKRGRQHLLVSEYLNIDTCFPKPDLELASEERLPHLALVDTGSGLAHASPRHSVHTKTDSNLSHLPQCPRAITLATKPPYNPTRQRGQSHLVYPQADVTQSRFRNFEDQSLLRRLSKSTDILHSKSKVIHVSFTDRNSRPSGINSPVTSSHKCTPIIRTSQRGRTLSDSSQTGPTSPVGSTFSDSLPREHQLGQRVARTVALVCASFVVAWLPIFIVLIINAVWAREKLAYTLNVVVMVAFAKSTLNPFIYALCHRSFRRSYSDVLARLCFVKP